MTKIMNSDEEGSCNCGAVRVIVKGGIPKGTKAFLCHCTGCRVSGGALGTVAFQLPLSSIEFSLSSPDVLRLYEDRAHTANGDPDLRTFCIECGTPIYGAKKKYPDVCGFKVALFRNLKGERELPLVVETFRKNCYSYEKPFVHEEGLFDWNYGPNELKEKA